MTHQSASADISQAYELVSDLCPDIDPDSYSIVDDSSDEVSKYKENPDYQEQEEVLLIPLRKPIRIRRGDQRSLSHLKSDI